MRLAPRLVPLLVGVVVALSCDTQQPAVSPALSIALNKSKNDHDANACVADKDHDKKNADVTTLCAVAIPGNPLVSVAKGWTDPETKAYYVDDQSNKAVDVIDTRSYTFMGRVTGFVGAATGASGGTITYGGGTATSNGQGPNSMALTEGGHQMWVSDGNSHVQVVDLHSLTIIATISTAIPACDGGTATTHYCGRVNEMTYDPEDKIFLVENPNPLDVAFCTTAGHNCTSNAAISYPTASPQKTLPPYASFISAKPPYQILGTISFPDAKGTTEAPVWDRQTHRFLLPVPTCSGATGATACGAGGGTQYVAVIDPNTMMVEKKFDIPDCAHLMPGITPGTGMINDLSIDEKDQHVIMPVCGKGNVVFDAQTGAVVNVVTEVSASDETWFSPGDGRFYVVGGSPGGNVPGGANTTSLGVVEGRSGLWLQNVLNVGGKIPAAMHGTNRAFTTVTVPAVVTGSDSTACSHYGIAAFTGCVTVFEHEDDKGDKTD